MDSSVLVRPATVDDAPLLAAVAVAAHAIYLSRLPAGVRPAPMDADYEAAVEHGEVWVADNNGTITGFLVIVRLADYILLECIAVHPDFQGQGVGRRLLTLVEERADLYGLRTIKLYTHVVMTENQQLYERLGYVETDRRRENGLDRTVYEKRL